MDSELWKRVFPDIYSTPVIIVAIEGNLTPLAALA